MTLATTVSAVFPVKGRLRVGGTLGGWAFSARVGSHATVHRFDTRGEAEQARAAFVRDGAVTAVRR
jgi:hypothetical protein